MNQVAVIIPLYKSQLSAFELLSLNQCFKILSAYPIIAVSPPNLDLTHIPHLFDSVITYEQHYFDDIAGYNRLMLSSTFYHKLIDYEYILIYQPDAFVFRDELKIWCNRGYDYIGAPWLRKTDYPDTFKKLKNMVLGHLHRKWDVRQRGTMLPSELQGENRVGNGGFSLRRTRKFYEICLSDRLDIERYNGKYEHQFNEDVFWGIEVNRKKKRLNIPDYQTAVYFAIENNCEYAFKLSKGKIPFGCHAWDKNLGFWEPILNIST